MAKAKDKNGDLDLKDPEIRALLHDDKAIASSAAASSAGVGLLTAATALPVPLTVGPDLIRDVKNLGSAEPLLKRITTAAMQSKENKGAAIALVLSALAVPVGAAIGYFSAKKELKKSQGELAKIEAREQAQSRPDDDALSEANGRHGSWVQRTEQQSAGQKAFGR